eukprot:4278659-Prymnesium_polylepis.1
MALHTDILCVRTLSLLGGTCWLDHFPVLSDLSDFPPPPPPPSQIQRRNGGLRYPGDLDKWYRGFLTRAKKMGVPLTERLAQQLSTGRMLVTAESITEYVEDVVKPEL